MEQHNNQPLTSNQPILPNSIEAQGVSEANRQWALIGHLSALLGYVIPFGNMVGPLVVWQMKKIELPFAAEQAKEALNFQISVTLYILACVPLCLILIGIPLIMIIALFALVMMIIAAVKVNGGVGYRYPFILRLVK